MISYRQSAVSNQLKTESGLGHSPAYGGVASSLGYRKPNYGPLAS